MRLSRVLVLTVAGTAGLFVLTTGALLLDYEPNPEPATPVSCIIAMDYAAPRAREAAGIARGSGLSLFAVPVVLREDFDANTRRCREDPAPQACRDALRAAEELVELAKDSFAWYGRSHRPDTNYTEQVRELRGTFLRSEEECRDRA